MSCEGSSVSKRISRSPSGYGQAVVLLILFVYWFGAAGAALAQTQLGKDIDGEAGDRSGYSVSLSSDGNRLAIGADSFYGDRIGYVRVYTWSGTDWLQIGADIPNTI